MSGGAKKKTESKKLLAQIERIVALDKRAIAWAKARTVPLTAETWREMMKESREGR